MHFAVLGRSAYPQGNIDRAYKANSYADSKERPAPA
jgi:hypothetical protein